ncbi:hypothetical protein [Aliiroseovarius sp.]|uniref:hypothetical protein n=1 Tax=Aliiroseovarius sp. TaxID=1872442 RepID=UPI003BADBD7F
MIRLTTPLALALRSLLAALALCLVLVDQAPAAPGGHCAGPDCEMAGHSMPAQADKPCPCEMVGGCSLAGVGLPAALADFQPGPLPLVHPDQDIVLANGPGGLDPPPPRPPV